MSDLSQASLGLGILPPLTAPYFDSSVFLAHIKQEAIPSRTSTRFAITNRLFSDAEQGKFKIYTSFFTLAEVRRLRESEKTLQSNEIPQVNELFARFLENEWIVPIELGRLIGEKAQSLGAQYGMNPGDAVHLASAIVAECNVLLVWDKRTFLNKLPPSTDPSVRFVEGVSILEPYWEGLAPTTS
jgi:predicted nucleic acid-binding protein